LGITAIEAVEMKPPRHETQNLVNFALKLVKAPAPVIQDETEASECFRDFVAQALTKDPDQRPSVAQLRQHAFVTNTSAEHMCKLLGI
jgi:serine/threonine protein kinase